ncbi:MAG: GNAT family N-acetyltransferase [Candidatus Thermoplasmatota archaeon]|nr:GNAT family N-acetyltransferase [Candidatus Thermoplasmatota archaeon]
MDASDPFIGSILRDIPRRRTMEVRITRDHRSVEDLFEIRRRVFVIEQGVDSSEEFDGHDDHAVHIGAYVDGEPIGCGRIRMLSGKAKLERIAVVKEMRGHGVGRAIVAFMKEVSRGMGSGSCYLHSQTSAVDFYVGCGFRKVGEPFFEAGIAHYMMEESG